MSSGVIVGYDGSEHAKEALRTALEVGKAYGERRLRSATNSRRSGANYTTTTRL
jgi:hypothetical protein